MSCPQLFLTPACVPLVPWWMQWWCPPPSWWPPGCSSYGGKSCACWGDPAGHSTSSGCPSPSCGLPPSHGNSRCLAHLPSWSGPQTSLAVDWLNIKGYNTIIKQLFISRFWLTSWREKNMQTTDKLNDQRHKEEGMAGNDRQLLLDKTSSKNKHNTKKHCTYTVHISLQN